MKKYYVNAKPYFEYKNRNKDTGALVDADTSVTIAVYDPHGNSVLASETESMSKQSTGVYAYNSWTIDSADPSGVYTAIATCNDTSDVTRDAETMTQFEIINIGETHG